MLGLHLGCFPGFKVLEESRGLGFRGGLIGVLSILDFWNFGLNGFGTAGCVGK